MSQSILPSVDRFTTLFDELLQQAKELKPNGSLEPLLRYEDLKEGIDAVGSLSRELGKVSNAAIEAAVRNIFYNLVVRPQMPCMSMLALIPRQSSTPIRDGRFGHVWNLLDIANTVSDFGEYLDVCLNNAITERSRIHGSRFGFAPRRRAP